ncbi:MULTISPECIES: SDR family NAD(P)-dependent oxidoreductase [unclassified Variovorax]|jgi:3-oxoacyl-[acyl-carrier protein] reductase|uniref:SDR family NAD(P)-dependent oxidoreductase n=1 Tax=unclassified Variovorax TaxID=663243 RepID=UPI000B809152|nr:MULTISPECIES: SDR family oxidoreductase [unclassified Variovorax]
MNSQSLAGKVAVVTGGSSGIGAACVLALANEGARVVVGYHRGRERAEALCARLPGSGHLSAAIPLDDVAAHALLARRLADETGRVDILVNSAGYTRRVAHDDLDAMDSAFFNEILVANVGGPFSVIRALLAQLRGSGDGLVVNISSVSAFTGAGSNVAYCAAKSALDTLTVSLARAFGPQVRFLSVSPAAVDTDFVAGRSRSELQKKAELTPLGRVVSPDDVARAVLACATHLKTATGTRLVIDGGHSL